MPSNHAAFLVFLVFLASGCAALLGCQADPAETDPGAPPAAEDVEWEVAEVATVVRVRWTTPEPTRGWVDFGETEALDRRTNTTAECLHHEVLLLGLPAYMETWFRVTTERDGATTEGEVDLLRTGPLPAGLPSFTISGDPESWSGYQVFAVWGQSRSVVIVDALGRIVWYDIEDRGFGVTRAILSRDRSYVAYNAEGATGDGTVPPEASELVRIAMDGTRLDPIAWPLLEHDFVELPDGSIGAITGTPDPDWPDNVFGDEILEVAPDGTVRSVFDVWDWWEDDPETEGFTHVNAIDYVPDEDAYYLSVYLVDSIAKIDRATGAPVWGLSGTLNSFDFVGDGGFDNQHQMDRTDDGILVFVNGTDEDPVSRIEEYRLDEDTMTAERTWVHAREPEAYSFVLGDVAALPDDQVRVTWTMLGEVQHLTRDGSVTWQLNSFMGHGIAYGEVVDDLYARE